MTIRAGPVLAPCSAAWPNPSAGAAVLVLAGLAALQSSWCSLSSRSRRRRRSPATVRGVLGNYAFVLASPGYRGYLVTFAAAFSAMFCYISASPFVMQEQLGMSVRGYATMFAVNGVGIIGGSLVNARLIGRVRTERLLLGALTVQITATLALLAATALYPHKWLIMALLFVIIAQISIVMGNTTALGTGLVRERAGSASALMGFAQFGIAGLVSPLMGLGDDPGVTMALGMTACFLVALGAAVYAHYCRADVSFMTLST